MSSYAPYMPGPRRGGFPAPPFRPDDYWASRKWVAAHVAASLRPVSDRIDALAARVEEVARKGIGVSEFRALVASEGLAYLSDLPSLGGSSFRLDTHEDLYVALAAVIPALGGTVEVV